MGFRAVGRPPDHGTAGRASPRIAYVRRPEALAMATVGVAPQRVPDAALGAALDLQVSGRADVVGRGIRAHLVRIGNTIREHNAINRTEDCHFLAQPSSGPGRTRTFV